LILYVPGAGSEGAAVKRETVAREVKCMVEFEVRMMNGTSKTRLPEA
jgi:hypothetical protein